MKVLFIPVKGDAYKHCVPLYKLAQESNMIAITTIFIYHQRTFMNTHCSHFQYTGQLASSFRQGIASFRAWGHESFPSLFGTPQQAEKERKEKERRHMLEYFTGFNNDLVGRVDAIFMKYAALYGPSCRECVYLNRLVNLFSCPRGKRNNPVPMAFFTMKLTGNETSVRMGVSTLNKKRKALSENLIRI